MAGGGGRGKGRGELDAFTRQQPSTGQPEMLTGCGRAFMEFKWNFSASRMDVIKKAQAVDEAGPGYVLSRRRMVTQN